MPNAQANLAKIPDDLRDEQVVLLADIASAGISAAESAEVKIGDTVAVFAQGPIGLCATAGAKLKGASLIIAVESDPMRAEMAKRMGADIVLDHTKTDVVAEIQRLTDGEGVDVAIEALGTQATFESALRVLRAGGTLSSLGVYSGKLSVPVEPFAAGLGDQKIITTLCPGWQRTYAPPDGVGAAWKTGSDSASDAHVFARPHHRGLQTFRRAAGRSNQSCHQTVTKRFYEARKSQRS